METRRVILYAALGMVLFYLWSAWVADYKPQVKTHPNSVSATSNQSSSHLLPTMEENETSLATVKDTTPVQNSEMTSNQGKKITVKTDVLNLSIDLEQGAIVNANLLQYPVSVDEKDKPVTLLQDNDTKRYIAESNLFTVNGQNINILDFNFTAEKPVYELQNNEDQLIVNLKGTNQQGLEVTKQFILTKGDYLVKVRYLINNTGNNVWKGYLNTRLLQTSPKEDKSSMFHIGSFTGASYSNPPEHRFKKVSFKDMVKNNLDFKSAGGWIAMQQHYFLSSWIPEQNSENRFYTRSNSKDYTIGFVSEPIVVAPLQQIEVSSKLYLGPEIASNLKAIAPNLDMTIDYGWLWFLSSLLFSLMKVIYSFVGNWGWSIVLVTVLIKLAFYRLSATSYKSMAGMRKLQPKLQALRERYGDDKAKISQATMELYKQEKVNPLGGCLPILIQIPVFIALYWVLLESVELRLASFLWLHDLTAPDPFHILPIIMGVTMLIQQKLNPAPPDPMQAKIMMFLPVFFTALFWNFPSGLVLYWTVNNALSILQQWYITKKYSNGNSSNHSKKLATVK